MGESQTPEQPERTPPNAPGASGGVPRPADQERPVERFGEPEQQPVARRREWVRAMLACSFAVLLIAMVVAIFVSAVLGGEQWGRVQEFIQIAFGTVAGLVGGVVGFYFGSQR